MHRKSLSDTEKVELVLTSIKKGVVIKDFCNQHGISRSAYYAWKNAVLHKLADGVSRKK